MPGCFVATSSCGYGLRDARSPRARSEATGESVRRRALPALMLAFAFGCSDGTGPAAGDAPGTFRATLSGALSQRVSGVASYALSPYTYEIGLVQNPEVVGFALTITADGGRPGVGTYALTPMTSPQSLPTVTLFACSDSATQCGLRDWGCTRSGPAPVASRSLSQRGTTSSGLLMRAFAESRMGAARSSTSPPASTRGVGKGSCVDAQPRPTEGARERVADRLPLSTVIGAVRGHVARRRRHCHMKAR